MSLTVATIVNNARDLHPALSVQNAPLPIALRAISRFEGDLVRDITSRVPGFLAKQVDVTLPLAVFENGVNLTTLIPAGWLDLTDGFFLYSIAPNPARTKRAGNIPWEQRDMPYMWPAYSVRDNVLYFLGSDANYAQFSKFTLTYTPLPAALATGASVTVLPDDALDCLAALLAAFWLKRLVGNPAFDVSPGAAELYIAEAAGVRADFLTRIWKTTQRMTYRVRDASSGGGY